MKSTSKLSRLKTLYEPKLLASSPRGIFWTVNSSIFLDSNQDDDDDDSERNVSESNSNNHHKD